MTSPLTFGKFFQVEIKRNETFPLRRKQDSTTIWKATKTSTPPGIPAPNSRDFKKTLFTSNCKSNSDYLCTQLFHEKFRSQPKKSPWGCAAPHARNPLHGWTHHRRPPAAPNGSQAQGTSRKVIAIAKIEYKQIVSPNNINGYGWAITMFMLISIST